MITAEWVKRWRRQWCAVNRKFSEDWEVIRWRTACNRQRWRKRRVRRGYYQVKNMILIVSVYTTHCEIFRQTLRRYVHLISSQISLSSVCNVVAPYILKALNFSAIFSHHLIAYELGQFVLKFGENRKGSRWSCNLSGSSTKTAINMSLYFGTCMRSVEQYHLFPLTLKPHFKVTPIFNTEYAT